MLVSTHKSKLLNDYQSFFFNIFIVLTYILIFISALGFTEKTEKYLTFMNNFISIYICLFLIYRFNPLRIPVDFTYLDRRIAFSAGLFILTTSVLTKYLTEIKLYTKTFFYKI
jgi:hypothetical protein